MKTRIEIRPLTASDYRTWKMAYENQDGPQNEWDHSHRKVDLSKSAFLEMIKKREELRKNDRTHSYAIFEKKTGEFIGIIMAMDVVRGITQSAYLGYALLNQHWGKGYMQEAIKVFYTIAFKKLELHRLQAGVEPQNKRSIKVVKSLGFRREGVSKKVVHLRGEWKDLVQFAITSEEVGIKWKKKA